MTQELQPLLDAEAEAEVEPLHHLRTLSEEHRITLEVTEDGVEGILGYAHHDSISYRPGIHVTKENIRAYYEATIPGNSSVKREYEIALQGLAGSIGGFFTFQEEAHPVFSKHPEHEDALRECRDGYLENVSNNLAKVIALGMRMELRKQRCSQRKEATYVVVESPPSANPELAAV